MVARKTYDHWGIEINTWNKSNIGTFVDCDCGHLAIRKNNTDRQIFRCSLCKKEYRQRKKKGAVVPIFKEL